ncbi:hypothetical protein COLO4_26460 [Corchorus olitorius]|uniref:Uncharacterized protein n=1 Tax=Corchorus olitorius TaxID=93759 RepID=A0A1R3HX09_9ROSI|nr:hypothetical protein COLO4_26460 [Corchorus olitorius]
MAKINLILLAAALFFVLLFSYGVTFSEERVLKADANVESAGNHVMIMSGHKSNLNRDILEDGTDDHVPKASSANNATAAYDADDFRPTTPGHSPGAGHSTGPASNNKN